MDSQRDQQVQTHTSAPLFFWLAHEQQSCERQNLPIVPFLGKSSQAGLTRALQPCPQLDDEWAAYWCQ